ncbi:dihydrofolate reductase family protein [Mesorhizobium sp. 43Arga]
MRKLIETTLMSLDGVVGSPWAWTGSYWDAESRGHALAALDRYEAFLFGRVTYETFAATWSQVRHDAYLDRINAMPKYVASTTLQEATWNARLLKGDVVEEIRRLKQQPGKDLIKYGTGKLDRTLLEHHLIDEIQVWIIPIVVGKGQRLYDAIDPASLKLKLEAQKVFGNGSVLLTYVPER